MERIEKLFREVKASPTREMAVKLKVELEQMENYSRCTRIGFLGLFPAQRRRRHMRTGIPIPRPTRARPGKKTRR